MTKKSAETSMAVESADQVSDESANIDEYAQTVELPIYVAPVKPSLILPEILYAKGVMVISGLKPQKYTGWLIPIRKSFELNSLFEALGVPAVRVRHYKGKEESYWQLDTIKGYILCTAIPDQDGPDAWRKTGIPYVWNDHKDTYVYGSQLQCLFFMKGLLELGYTAPLVLTFSRTVTKLFIENVLQRQSAMLEVVKKALRKQNKHDELAFYAYWIELTKASEEFTTTGGGSYIPPATTITAPLTGSYVREHQTPQDHLEIIESFLPMLQEWAKATSAKLLEPPRDNNSTATPEESAQTEQPGSPTE